jgi:fructosamine-3-kinase
MNINSKIKETIEAAINEEIISNTPVGGGCIADSKILKTSSGKKYFLKTFAEASEMFLKEANGLKELSKSGAIRVPKVFLEDTEFLLLENIEQMGRTDSFFTDFGTRFAKMHKYKGKEFGFFEDNYIGSSPQYNLAEETEKISWSDFYFNKRLLPQLKMAKKNGYSSPELITGIMDIGNNIQQILEGSEEEPSLLHGDLWGGNYISDENGQAVIIDPAVYYGHREADLAMTKMFGGFTEEFYQAYQKEYPLAENWEYREGLYLLYHYLNHLNLFGSSYLKTCLRLIQIYL